MVEIDPKVTELAKKFFNLDKIIKDYDLENSGRLNLVNDDGRIYLKNNKIKYDAILNDAFSGETPARTLCTIEAIELIKSSLNDGGLYLTNILGGYGKYSGFLYAEVNTLKKIFKNVYVIPCGELTNERPINNMVIASDSDYDFDFSIDLKIPADTPILTDDYSPVEMLSDF